MDRGPHRRVAWGRVIVAGVIAIGISYGGLALRAVDEHRSAPPPPGGYFLLQPVGSYARLPDDAIWGGYTGGSGVVKGDPLFPRRKR